ncbi:MAG: inositol-3-phosphate synthase [Chloroflexota bacterium]|nr:inositol-3-phosphate synthase [Chloroflexota bacterium]
MIDREHASALASTATARQHNGHSADGLNGTNGTSHANETSPAPGAAASIEVVNPPSVATGGGRGGRKVRVAVVGVGNCASSLVQGASFYRHAAEDEFIPGLMHTVLGGYHIGDIEFSAAFDVDAGKVGADLSQAIWATPNNTVRFADVPHLGVPVQRGPTHDGLGHYGHARIDESEHAPGDIARILRDTGTDVMINYLPVGSEVATRWYMEQALAAGCGVVNCIPVFIARESEWNQRFAAAGLPIVGDDIKSQVGATIVHRVLARLFRDRGVKLERTSQLNVGGNMDFYNMLERSRLESKKISKTDAVTSQMDYDLGTENVHIGPSDYVEWLSDRKWAYIRLEGQTFGNVPLNVELKLEVWDSPNSAGVVIDALRCCKLALDRGLGGALEGPAAYFMKSPPVQHRDEVARQMVEEFIAVGTPSQR